jgi:type VI protein secretion system component VasK
MTNLMVTRNPTLWFLGAAALLLLVWAIVDRLRLGTWPLGARTRLWIAATFVVVCIVVEWFARAGRESLP